MCRACPDHHVGPSRLSEHPAGLPSLPRSSPVAEPARWHATAWVTTDLGTDSRNVIIMPEGCCTSCRVALRLGSASCRSGPDIRSCQHAEPRAVAPPSPACRSGALAVRSGGHQQRRGACRAALLRRGSCCQSQRGQLRLSRTPEGVRCRSLARRFRTPGVCWPPLWAFPGLAYHCG